MKNKKYKYDLKSRILITINYIMAFLLLLSACALDSESYIPAVKRYMASDT